MAKTKISMIIVPESELLDYITLEEFADKSGKKPATIIRRADEIPGLVYTKDGSLVLRGTRYPHKRNYKIDSSAKCRYILLRAINANEYISHTELGMEKADFDLMLRQCADIGMIEERGLPNRFGANGYVCTVSGEKFIREHADYFNDNKWSKLEGMIPALVAAASEGATKALLAKIFPGEG